MSPSDAANYITVIGAVGTAANVILMLIIKNAISGLKLWAIEKFVTKEEISNFLSPLKDNIQVSLSEKRVRG